MTKQKIKIAVTLAISILCCQFLSIQVSNPVFAQNEEVAIAKFIVSQVRNKSLYDWDKLEFKQRGSPPSCRSEFYLAKALLATGDFYRMREANEILSKYLKLQVRGKDSPYLGSWYYEEYLLNSDGLGFDMFAPIPLIQIYYSFFDFLTEENKAQLLEGFKWCAMGLKINWFSIHSLPEAISHTNNYLLYMADLLLTSDIVGDYLGSSCAKVAFDNWIDYTLRFGITEFNSPIYYKVDGWALMMIELYSKDPTMISTARNWFDVFLADLNLHFLWQKQYFVGANSSSYSVLRGEGGSSNMMQWIFKGKIENPSLDDILLTPFKHTPSSWVSQLAQKASTMNFSFTSPWGDDFWAVRQTWFGKDFALGTSGKTYGSSDRTLVLDRYDLSWPVSIVSVIGTNDHPWELANIGGGSGYNQLKTTCFNTQIENKALQITEISIKGESNPEMVRISLVFILPANHKLENVSGSESDQGLLQPIIMRSFEALIVIKPFIHPPQKAIKPKIVSKQEFTTVEYQIDKLEGKFDVKNIIAGFSIEVIEDAILTDLESEELKANSTIKKTQTNLKISYKGLHIDYSSKFDKAINLPAVQAEGLLKTPWTCVDEKSGILNYEDTKIPLRRY